MFGKLPPPYGGVTVSLTNLMYALTSVSHTSLLFCLQSLLSYKKYYDVSHIHYTVPWKRFIGLLLGKIFAKRVVFTLHGRNYKLCLFNKLNIILSDGVIFLNKESYNQYHKYFRLSLLSTSVYKEGIKPIKNSKNYFSKKKSFKYILIYSYKKVLENHHDLYGIDFILQNIHKLPSSYKIVLLDPSMSYSTESNNSIVHITHHVSFMSLLSNVDIYVRPTIKDGDSVAIHEALNMGVPVLASDVISRPKGVYTYELFNWDDFLKKLQSTNLVRCKHPIQSSIYQYLEFCYKL